MGLLKSLFGSFVEKGFVNDAENLLAICRSYGQRERSSLLASTRLALAFLILDHTNDKEESIFLALDAMESGRLLSDKEKGILSLYNLKLMNLQNQAHKSSSQINNLIATGIPIWITSNRALMNISILPYAREIWRILESGDLSMECDILDGFGQQLRMHPLGEMLGKVRNKGTPRIFQAH